MAALLVGRIVDWTVLGRIASVSVTSESFSLSGIIQVDGQQINKAKAVRDQIVGLMDIGEPFVPLRIVDGPDGDGDPTLDGMVKIRSASAQLDRGALEDGRFPWSITADRVPGGALPNIESPLIGGYRNNPGRVSSAVVPWHAVPGATLDYYDGASTFQSVPYTLASETGDVDYYQLDDGVRRQTARYALPPANWYDGAARVEQAYPDGAYYATVGRLMYSGLSSTGWRLSNSILRVKPSATAGALDLQMWETGTGWGAVHSFALGAYDGVTTYTVNRINTVSILRNSPEDCRVRLTVGLTSGGIDYPQRAVLDLRLRRGARVVEGRLSLFGGSMTLTVGPTPTEAGVALASGVGGYTTTGDAQSNTALVMSASGGSFATGSSAFTTTSALTGWSFGLGIIQNGGGAAAPWAYTDLRDEYLAPFGERMTVVGW